jgi:aminopeptidase
MHEVQNLREGISVLVNDYLTLSEKTKAAIAYPAAKRELAYTFAELMAPCRVSTVEYNKPFRELLPDFAAGDVIIFLEDSNSTYGRELAEFLLGAGRTKRAYRLFDFSFDLLTECFASDRAELTDLNRAIIAWGTHSSRIVAKSDCGTDLEIGLDRRFGWVDSCGRYAPGLPGILPPSEVATFSAEVNGVIVADGAINYNLGSKLDPRLKGRPIRAELKDGHVVSMGCDDPFMQLVLNLFLQVENSARVGEIGFGTNIGIRKFVPFISHINERFPTLHIGLGSNNQGAAIAGWECKAHLDLILDECDIWFDELLIHHGNSYCVPRDPGIAPGTRVVYHDTF